MLAIYALVLFLWAAKCDIYNVEIATDDHVNVIDRRFLSFTIDPKLLFSSIGKYNRKDCSCMASSLSPAYVRIAGPTTAHLAFTSDTVAINSPYEKTSVTYKQWHKFVKWSKRTGLDVVLALNGDPEHALASADGLGVSDVFWQLGYECKNQSIEEYMNGLETLRASVEAFHRPGWKTVPADVSGCLRADTASDFENYVTLSTGLVDALFLDGDSSTRELERMSQTDRTRLLKLLSESRLPLWLAEGAGRPQPELRRAVDWLTALGSAAKNGFDVHYTDVLEEELSEPTLSFYMALLFKNLVGERVLEVEMEGSRGSRASLFAHCASLRGEPAPGALTLYATNMDDAPAKFSLRLSEREEGGDIMQFILGHDENGNIAVNGRAMYYEGDMRPVVKRVRPFKALLINLPPKSFGFWVLADTKVKACRTLDNEAEDTAEILVLSREEPSAHKVKRSVGDRGKSGPQREGPGDSKDVLSSRVQKINRDLKKMQGIFQTRVNDNVSSGLRRQNRIRNGQSSSKFIKNFFDSKSINGIGLLRKDVSKIQNSRRATPRKTGKKYEANSSRKDGSYNETSSQRSIAGEAARTKRSVRDERTSKRKDVHSSENLIEADSERESKSPKASGKGHKRVAFNGDVDDYEAAAPNAVKGIVLETQVEEDGAVLKIGEEPNYGILATTFEDLFSLFSGLNERFRKVWDIANLLA